MKIETIPNRGPASLAPEIEHCLRWATHADIASAFITPAAIRRLESALGVARKEKRAVKVRVVFGLYQRFTPPEALRRLVRLHKNYPGVFFVRVARNNRFHWKLYSFSKGAARRLYIGSANFTEDGLSAEGELSVKISANSGDSISKALQSEFERIWRNEDESFLLSAGCIKKYDNLKRPTFVVSKPAQDDALRRILRKPKRLKQEPEEAAKPRSLFAGNYVTDETVKVIEVETNWHRKGWDYISYLYKSEFAVDRDARVLLKVDFFGETQQHRLRFVRVADTAAELVTPDGKYFIAYERLAGGWSRKFETIKKELGRVGLTKRSLKANRKLNRTQLDLLCRLLHVNL